jgi:hypothetical protein
MPLSDDEGGSTLYMSLSSNPELPEKGIDRSQTKTMVLSDEHELPFKVANVSRDELRKYAQCKRIGNYLLGRTVGEGSFAKVKEAIHILTGEKVRYPYTMLYSPVWCVISIYIHLEDV